MQRDPAIIFNNKLADFIKRMIHINPKIEDFQILLSTCELIVNIDYTLPIQIYNHCITHPYKTQIYEKKEDFFLSQEYSEYDKTIASCGYSFDIVNQLKKVWTGHTEKQKNEIWNYLIILCKLSENYPIASIDKINNLSKCF